MKNDTFNQEVVNQLSSILGVSSDSIKELVQDYNPTDIIISNESLRQLLTGFNNATNNGEFSIRDIEKIPIITSISEAGFECNNYNLEFVIDLLTLKS
jgi:hypothetical protein